MIKISIVIPVKNAGAAFGETLSAIFGQRGIPPLEIIVIDSGSTDITLELCHQYPVTLVQIPPSEFGHGRTRNYGASIAHGDLLVFLVQDAVPSGTDWLKNLLRPLEMNQQIAGSYSRNVPRTDAPRRQALEIERYFQPQQRLQSSPADHIFSNVSSAIRKKVLDEIPFPAVEFGEDQFWAKNVLAAGYLIHYEPTSIVIHSHHDGLKKAFQRGCQEGGFAKTIGQELWHPSYLIIFLEALYEAVKWTIRGDLRSCWYSITMAAWHCGFHKGFAAKR